MESKSLKQNLKKKLAIATMAASLGVSLGVPVGDVLADDLESQSPPGYSRQDKDNMSSEQIKGKSSYQNKMSNQGKESIQGKFKSKQGKMDSNLKDLESSQGKVGYKVEPKSTPVKN